MNTFEKLYLGLFFVIIMLFIIVVHNQNNTQKVSQLDIVFFDIGQGDATFITFPTGQQMLIDCSKDSGVLEKLGGEMDFFDKTIDYLVITHPDYDHYGGCIDVLKTYNVKEIIYTDKQKEGSFFTQFLEVVDQEISLGAIYTKIDHPEMWNIGDVQLSFLYPNNNLDFLSKEIKNGDDSNNTSIVIKITYGDQDVLFTGDAEMEIEQYLVDIYQDQLDVEILKIGHHGSNSSSIEPFIETTSPEVAIISAGLNNSYHHPTDKVLDRLQRFNASIYRTDLQGSIYAEITTSSYKIFTNY